MRDSRAPYPVDVTFDFRRCQGLKADPHSYEDHLKWVTEYTLRQRNLRAEHRTQVRASLMLCSIAHLRAVFVFAVFEHQREVEVHRGRLDEPQRAAIWIDLLRAGLVKMSPQGFAATHSASRIHANARRNYSVVQPRPRDDPPETVDDDWMILG